MSQQQKRSLEKHLKPLIDPCTAIVRDLLDSDAEYTKKETLPIFRSGQLIDVKEEDHPIYLKLRHAVQNSDLWKKDASFQNAKNHLKDMLEANELETDEDLDAYAIKQISYFIIHLEKKKIADSACTLKESLQRFFMHIDELSSIFYATPLYNVQSNVDKIQISEDVYIRKITDEEYSKMVHLGSLPLDEIDSYQQRLNFILVCKVPASMKDSKDEAIQKCALVLDLLRLFKDGIPQFGRIYALDAEHLEINQMRLVQSHYETPVSYKPVKIESSDIERFCRFYHAVSELRKKTKTEFLFNAIRRFGMAYMHRSDSNKIVDYVIALESLLAGHAGETTLRLAHRVSALCGDTDEERLYNWEFMKEAYKFRSGIVHQSVERPVSVQSRRLSMKSVSEHIHKLTKTSILRIISLLSEYEKQDDILDELDRSIYDRQRIQNIQKIWNAKNAYV